MKRCSHDPFAPDTFPDRAEYLHGCKHGHTRSAGCRLGCKRFDEILISSGPNGYGPIVATDEEYASGHVESRGCPICFAGDGP